MTTRSWTLRRAAACLAFTLGVGLLTAQPPAAGDLRPQQEKNRELFLRFQRELLTLAQRLDASDKPEDKDRAKVLFAALELIRREGVDGQFQKLLDRLKGGAAPGDLDQLGGQDAQLNKALDDILQLLLTDDSATRLKQERERLEKMLAEARDVLRGQKTVRAMTEAGKTDAKRIAADQDQVKERTKDLARRMGPDDKAAKPGTPKGEPKDAKPGDSKPGEPKDSKPKDGKPGDPKDGKPKDGAPKPGDPKDGGPKPSDPKDGGPKPSDPKPGDPKGGDPKPAPPMPASPGQPPPPGGQPPPPPTPGRKQIQDAVPHQEKAADELNKPDRDKAAKAEEKAIKELEEAVKELEKRLKQLREEEAQKLLANLEARCAKMLAMQTEVYQATKVIDAAVARANGVKTTADVQKAQQQSDKELEIVAEAEKALKLLASEGTAVAFARILEEVKVDMQAVQRRLAEAYVGRDTQAVEENVIAMLTEMLAALKKAQQDQKQQPPPPPGEAGQPPKPGDQALFDAIAELKLIKSLQTQVNARTKVQGDRYQGEQASDPIIAAELDQLAARQAKLLEMVQKLATGANK